MDVFRLRDTIIDRYSDFVTSFVRIKDPELKAFVAQHIDSESLWPEPLIQLNPAFQNGGWIDELVTEGLLHKECCKVFRVKDVSKGIDKPLRLHKHQVDGLRKARERKNYVLTTGTGSGKSLSYIVPIVDHVLRTGPGRGVQAIVVYPMNALCNSQYGELRKFLQEGYAEGKEPVRFSKYTGQESQDERQLIVDNPPDIILTNYVMLELLLTRPFEKKLVAAAAGLSFLVLDELHTYRGRQGADVALLVRRVREACRSPQMLCVGTSATMSSAATPAKQKQQIAEVASRLFGAEVTPDAVVGESLSRQTPPVDVISNAAILKANILAEDSAIPSTYEEFIRTPLAVWLESYFGLQKAVDDSLVRSKPRAISGDNSAAAELASLAGVDVETCAKAIRRWLMAGYACDPDPVTQRRPFAFRLHQFISRGDTVYGSLEDDADRVLSLSGQQFASEDRERILLPMCFCRECGAAYYAVWKSDEREGIRFEARELNERIDEPPHREAGFLYRDPANPWPQTDEEIIQRLPDDWLDEAGAKPRLRKSLSDEIPVTMRISTAGELAGNGLEFQYTRTPFRFCLGCGVSYRVRRGASDFAQLSTLASGGRSSATSILGLTAVQLLKQETTLSDRAKKLLSFTDNRQDASLQAGHFNDFIEVSLLRAALFKAVSNNPEGIDHDELPLKVFRALNLDFALYAREPGAEFALKNDTEKAFRNVLAYRLYRDLRRGWRIASPNLEQCGLLQIHYPSLSELCASDKHWANTHGALATASPSAREAVTHVLLDFMRRELAIDVDFLTAEFFERLQQQSAQRLREPWAITGALQIVESTESVQAALPDPVTSQAPRLFAAYDDQYLVSLGLPPDWLTVLRQITNEDQLLGVATRLPEEVAERLLTLASGELVTPPVPVSPDLPLDQSEDNQRRFVVIKDSTELQAILDRPIEDWIRFLHPSQRNLVTKEFRGPSRVSGAAGTGKTVVGMHRARALATKGLKVLMTSFVGTLCRNIERNMDVLCACTQQEFDSTVRGRITVNTIHKIALTLVKKVDSRVKPVDDEQLEKILSRRNSQSGFLFETGFPLAEWNGVIDPQGIQSWEQYRSAPRTGRGKPLTVKQRRDAWSIFQGAIDDLRQQALYTWSQICIKAAELLESGQLESPFDAVIVDEVQDLQPQELRLLAALTNKAPENLMLLGDAGQRIYPGGFSLSRLGIDVRGRSTILRINYRTTDQIRRFADQLIPPKTDDFNEAVEDRKSRSLLTGPVPQLHGCRTEHEQQQFVVQRIRDAIAKGLQPREIAVFARSHNQLKGVAKAVADAAIAVHNVGSGSEEGDSSGVNFATMHRAKGLEFKFVFVIGCSNDIVPHRYTLTQLTDQADIDAGLERERQLLYVAITRARDEAFITWVGEPSEFLLPHIQSQNGTTT